LKPKGAAPGAVLSEAGKELIPTLERVAALPANLTNNDERGVKRTNRFIGFVIYL
jgi:hypothetical protein